MAGLIALASLALSAFLWMRFLTHASNSVGVRSVARLPGSLTRGRTRAKADAVLRPLYVFTI